MIRVISGSIRILSLKPMGGLLLGMAFFHPSMFAQNGLIIAKAADGHYVFQTPEELLINQSRRVKLVPENLKTLDPGSSKSLMRADIDRAGVLQGDGQGGLFQENGSSRQRVLPENFTVREAVSVSSLKVPLTLTIVKDKKKKDSTDISAAALCLYVSEADPDRVAQRFVFESHNFPNFDEQLRAIEGFAKAFPDSPARDGLRGRMKAELESAQSEFDAGGSYNTLLDAGKLASMATRLFPSDRGITGASDGVQRRINSTTETKRLLLGLAGIEDWNTFLATYQRIELHEASFPELEVLHRRALEEKTRLSCLRAHALLARHDPAGAQQAFAEALSIDPTNPEIQKLVESARMLTAQSEAKAQKPSWKKLPKDSPEDRLYRQALYTANRAIEDRDYSRARAAINQAERESPGSPEVLLARASLLAGGDEIADAVPLLDRYDAMVTEGADREKGDALRNRVIYELRKRRETLESEIKTYLSQGEYTKLYAASSNALKLDEDDPYFLYAAGVSAAVLRKQAEAKPWLEQYLKVSDTLASDEEARVRARRLLLNLEAPAFAEPNGTLNWFSGRRVVPGAYYDPASLTFQIPVEIVNGFKFRMNFVWDHGRLTSIRTEFEDEKARQDYASMTPAKREGKAGSSASMGNFVFNYGGLSQRVRSISTGKAMNTDMNSADSNIHVLKNADGTVRLINENGDPEVVLAEDPRLNTKAVDALIGPITTVVAGNSFFNPFIWDGVHYFTISCDSQGRVTTAKEWGLDNFVRFRWDNHRLVEISAYHSHDGEPYYRRTISYSGANITSEEYTEGSHSGHIKYVYSKDALVAARVEDSGVHDGKTWIARLQPVH